MGWEKLVPGRGGWGRKPPHISVLKRGEIAWNKATQELLGWAEWVDLLYDVEAQRIGVRQVPEGSTGCFHVQQQKAYVSFKVSAKSALREMGLIPLASYRREARMLDGVVVIDIGDGEADVDSLPGGGNDGTV